MLQQAGRPAPKEANMMRLSILALCAALTMPAIAATPTPSAPPAAARMRHGLTPEEHFLYMRHLHGDNWRKLSVAQRCERAKSLRQQRRNMSAADRARLKQQLDAEWAKLPAAE